MRDYGLDKGMIRFFDDSARKYRGWDKNFWGFRKMFRDYLEKLNVAYYDTCCPEATTTDIVPVRYNDATNVIQYYNRATDTWSTVDAGAFVSDSVSLDDGSVGSLAVRLGADGNNGLYGISDSQMGFATEGVLRAGVNTNGLFTDSIEEQTAANGVNVDGVLLKDGGVSNAGATMIAGFYPTTAQEDIAAGTGGAINVTSFLTTINTDAGGDAYTLANGTQIGQRKRIRLVADGGGDGVVTPATALVGGATTITFNDAGDYVDLIWNGTAWAVLDNSGTTIA